MSRKPKPKPRQQKRTYKPVDPMTAIVNELVSSILESLPANLKEPEQSEYWFYSIVNEKPIVRFAKENVPLDGEKGPYKSFSQCKHAIVESAQLLCREVRKLRKA